MKTLSNYTKILLGQKDGENIYLSPPSWDCGWYWGFGYLGNKNCHYHVDGLEKIETYDFEKSVRLYEFVNLYDGFKKHFGNSFIVKREKDIWTLAELFKTFYNLKETAEILGRGGSHLTSNPCKDLIINKDETERINNIVLPQIFEEIYKILYRNADSEKTFKKLVSINLKGNTQKVVDFMKENQIHTDDLKNIDGLTKDDYNIIHTYFWRDFHATKNDKKTI
jgi:hypothetical protein